jgi:hypothetical protein
MLSMILFWIILLLVIGILIAGVFNSKRTRKLALFIIIFVVLIFGIGYLIALGNLRDSVFLLEGH